MRKMFPYIVGGIIAALALMPPEEYAVFISVPIKHFEWLILISAFFGFYLWNLKVPIWVKIFSVFSFLNCFFSSAPFLSFIAYPLIVAGCYFFVLCYNLKEDDAIFSILKCIVVLNLFLMALQSFGIDPLLNFGIGENISCFGVVGQKMQLASFSVIAAAALLPAGFGILLFPFIATVFCTSVGALFSAGGGLLLFLFYERKDIFFKVALFIIGAFILMLISTEKLHTNLSDSNGRVHTWRKTIELADERPLTGWGVGTYKAIFHGLSGINSLKWKMAHNCWLQFLFEYGYLGFWFIVGYTARLFFNLSMIIRQAIYRQRAVACLVGLLMICLNMSVHFPTRQTHTIAIIIFFIAYCERLVHDAAKQT